MNIEQLIESILCETLDDLLSSNENTYTEADVDALKQEVIFYGTDSVHDVIHGLMDEIAERIVEARLCNH